MVLTSNESFHYYISTYLTNRVTDWQRGGNNDSSREKENYARSPHTAIRPTSTNVTNPK